MFLAHTMSPFPVVDLLGFRNLICTLEPCYIIPSRTHFTENVIPDLYLHTRQEVQSTKSEAESVAITTDGWTSRTTKSYITITAHLIDKVCDLRRFIHLLGDAFKLMRISSSVIRNFL
ncbi:hypothetical protein ACJMK2_007019 [Sinanodonta woodiana]|uniref:DUF659 domain-containing protein n=1 Tax=Sinanodonta woodiana TaxID=1069815 RepID=A0ABD3VH59_SINWO